ncbi:hypothetical protein ONZ45_g9535 [Pleurotus djamor]|nr:hypothetical protein ONZ45_g9535 [Pleurotus djamor]
MDVDDQYGGGMDAPQLEMPGGDDFSDITSLFVQAAQHMEQESLLMMEGFELQQAMNAFEIGEPRLDTGMVDEQDVTPPFNPLEALLPNEVCWIMDRSFTYEMLWHAGNCLSHSVLTIQYVHHLADMDPDYLYLRNGSAKEDRSRPIQLVTIVLRAFMTGLLKSCDFAWRRLNEGSTKEMEDWQSDKCEVSFLEGVPPNYVLSKLEEASRWLTSQEVPSEAREPLLARLTLRNNLLQLLALDVHKDLEKFQGLIVSAQRSLDFIRAHPSREPGNTSPARLAFDPHLPRLFACSVPLRILDVPPILDIWDAWSRFLNDWSNIVNSVANHDLTTWEMPVAVLTCRLNCIREVVSSGFQLELYNPEERAFAYLYIVQLIEVHLSSLDSLDSVVPLATIAKERIEFQRRFLTALQLISLTLFSVAPNPVDYNAHQLYANFTRRYKWAFRPEYDSIVSPTVASPDVTCLLPACAEIRQDATFSPSDTIKHAQKILSDNLLDEESLNKIILNPPFFPVEGLVNLRDALPSSQSTIFPGRITKPLCVFRSGELTKVTKNGKTQLARLGIKKVFDSRSDFEVEMYQVPLLNIGGIEVVKCPVIKDPVSMSDRLASFAADQRKGSPGRALFASLYRREG